MTSSNRRRFLKLIGASGVGVALAGCGDNGGDEDDGADDDGTEDGETDGAGDGTEDGTENETEDGTENETEDGEEDGAENETEDGEEEETGDGGNLRVAHLAPDAPNVDVYVDEEPVLEDVAFATFSEYLSLEPGTYPVRVTAAGDEETVVFDEDVEIGEGWFTAAALGEIAEENRSFTVEVFEDDLSDPGEEARVRVIHASPDAQNVDITVEESGDTLFEDVGFGEASATTVPAGEYVLEVRAAGEDGEPLGTFGVELASGAVYTAAAVGYLEPDPAPDDEPFDLVVVTDSEGGM